MACQPLTGARFERRERRTTRLPDRSADLGSSDAPNFQSSECMARRRELLRGQESVFALVRKSDRSRIRNPLNFGRPRAESKSQSLNVGKNAWNGINLNFRLPQAARQHNLVFHQHSQPKCGVSHSSRAAHLAQTSVEGKAKCCEVTVSWRRILLAERSWHQMRVAVIHDWSGPIFCFN